VPHEEPHDDGDYPAWALSGLLVFSALVLGLITAAIMVIDPSSSSGVVTWIVTGALALAGFKLASFCVQRALEEGARGHALAMVSVGIVCLYLLGQAVTSEDVGLSIDPRGTAGESPATYSESFEDDNGDGSIGDELDDADGDYVPNGTDANPADPTIQFSEDYH
jgi:hypothetical protein